MRRAAVLSLVLLAACARPGHEPGYPMVGVTQDRLTLEPDDGAALTSVDRATRRAVAFRVTLNGAPVGERLPLACSWTAPSGKVAHQNAWRTQRVATPVWETHCKCPFGPSSETGAWKVEMTLDGRFLRSASLEVK